MITSGTVPRPKSLARGDEFEPEEVLEGLVLMSASFLRRRTAGGGTFCADEEEAEMVSGSAVRGFDLGGTPMAVGSELVWGGRMGGDARERWRSRLCSGLVR